MLAYLVDALLLVILIPIWMIGWSFSFIGGPFVPTVWTVYLWWGSMWIPLAAYLVAVYLARNRFDVPPRILAIMLSPIVVVSFVATSAFDGNVAGSLPLLALALPFGAVARMPWRLRRSEAD